MFTSIVKWYYGYVRIRVSGFSVERFLNLCGNRGLLIWDITKEEEYFYLKIQKRDFFHLKAIARKTGTKVVILRKYGLPFIMPKILKRKYFLLGILMVLFFIYISSSFIWTIEWKGNITISDDELNRFLNRESINIGKLKKKTDVAELEKELRNSFSSVTWASVKIRGSKLLIEIKENEVPNYEENTKYMSGEDIVSPFEGEIESIVVRSGLPLVKKGEHVEKGTILVTGTIPIYNDDATIKDSMQVIPDADILLKHTIEYRDYLRKCYTDKVPTGRNAKSLYFKFGDSIFSLGNKKTFLLCDTYLEERGTTLTKLLKIPFKLGIRLSYEYQYIERERTFREAEAVLRKRISIYEKRLLEKGVQIIENNVKMNFDGELYINSGDMILIEKLK